MNKDHQALTDHCFELSQEMLVMNGEFHPFGAFLGEGGRVQHLGIEIEPKNIPNNGAIIERLLKLVQDEGINAYALCFEVSVQLEQNSAPQDAICVELSDAEAPRFYQPFAKSSEEINFDDIFAVK